MILQNKSSIVVCTQLSLDIGFFKDLSEKTIVCMMLSLVCNVLYIILMTLKNLFKGKMRYRRPFSPILMSIFIAVNAKERFSD